MAKTPRFLQFISLSSVFLALFLWYLYHVDGHRGTVTNEGVPFRKDKTTEPTLIPPTHHPDGQEKRILRKRDPLKIKNVSTWDNTPECPKHLTTLRNSTAQQAPGPITIHVTHPECREHIVVPDSNPMIYVSVKTTGKYHRRRLSLQLFTWMETINHDQLYVITDEGVDDVWIKEAENSGIHVVKTGCPYGHNMDSLCCKSGAEYEQYYTAISNGKTYRWFCHFDDDEYLNIGTLSTQLSEYNSSKRYYLGNWPRGNPIAVGNLTHFPGAKRTRYMYATGASYCVSSPLMMDVKKYFQGGEKFVSTCHKMDLTDDLTIGAIIEGVLEVHLTHVPTMMSQLESFHNLTTDALKNMITISGKVHNNNRVQIPGSPFSGTEDPTGFFSYHCLLYPHTSWCGNKHTYQTSR